MGAAFKLAIDPTPPAPPDGPTVGISITYPQWLVDGTTDIEAAEIDIAAEALRAISRRVLHRLRGIK